MKQLKLTHIQKVILGIHFWSQPISISNLAY